MILKPFKPFHLSILDTQGCNVEIDNELKTSILMRGGKNIFSAFDGDKILAIGGVSAYWKGVGEAWVLYTKDLIAKKFSCYKATKIIFQAIVDGGAFFRIQCTCLQSARHCRFLECLGFEKICNLRRYYTETSDAVMYEYLV